MKYLVALQIKTRFIRPNIGPFIYNSRHERHVWKDKEISDPGELAECVNEALEFQDRMDQLNLQIRVMAVEEKGSPIPAPEAIQEQTVAPRRPGRPPKLITALEAATA